MTDRALPPAAGRTSGRDHDPSAPHDRRPGGVGPRHVFLQAPPAAAVAEAAAKAEVPSPRITAPPAGSHGFPFLSEADDLAGKGYLEQEFVLSGTGRPTGRRGRGRPTAGGRSSPASAPPTRRGSRSGARRGSRGSTTGGMSMGDDAAVPRDPCDAGRSPRGRFRGPWRAVLSIPDGRSRINGDIKRPIVRTVRRPAPVTGGQRPNADRNSIITIMLRSKFTWRTRQA